MPTCCIISSHPLSNPNSCSFTSIIINSDIRVISKAIKGESKRTSVLEGSVNDIYNQIQNTQGMIRAFKEDPNFNNRY